MWFGFIFALTLLLQSNCMAPVIERLDAIPTLGLGEGPHWDPSEQVLYLVDLLSGNIYCWSPITNKTIQQNVGAHASFIIPIKGTRDELVVGCKQELLHIKWDRESNKIVKRHVLVNVKEPSTNQINDAKCDAVGRIWFGTFNTSLDRASCAQYSFSPSEGLKTHESNVTVSNGLAFSIDDKTMWHIDTMKDRVDQYSVDIIEGARDFEKTIIDFNKSNIVGKPDGMTVDADGNLWIACVFGSQVIHVDGTTGKVLKKIDFPKSPQITSVAFGGRNMDELFVTSGSNLEFSGYEHTKGSPEGGSTFRVTGLGAKGVKPYEFQL